MWEKKQISSWLVANREVITTLALPASNYTYLKKRKETMLFVQLNSLITFPCFETKKKSPSSKTRNLSGF